MHDMNEDITYVFHVSLHRVFEIGYYELEDYIDGVYDQPEDFMENPEDGYTPDTVWWASTFADARDIARVCEMELRDATDEEVKNYLYRVNAQLKRENFTGPKTRWEAQLLKEQEEKEF